MIRVFPAAVALAAVACACSAAAWPATPSPPAPPYVGVAAVKPSQLSQFQKATGFHPNIVEIYRSFGAPYPKADIAMIAADGALPLIQLNPYGVSLKSIGNGAYDKYLRAYAAAIGSQQVVLSFAPEANGNWYTWGCGRAKPSLLVAAWRTIHSVMSKAGATHVIWMWDVNKDYPKSCPIAPLWPGASYVTWVGLDGYFRNAGTTFKSVYSATIADIRAITSDPIVIAEVGVPDVAGATARMNSLFAGAESTKGLIGVVYFSRNDGHYDFRLQDDPALLAAFKRGAQKFLHGS